MCIQNIVFLIAGWQIEFRLGPSLFGRNINIFINHPLTDKEFQRNEYYQIKWTNESAVVQLTNAGSFHYYISDALLVYFY